MSKWQLQEAKIRLSEVVRKASELVRPRPKASIVRWVGERDEDDLLLSVITIGELEKGIAKLPDSTKRATLEQWIRRERADCVNPWVAK